MQIHLNWKKNPVKLQCLVTVACNLTENLIKICIVLRELRQNPNTLVNFLVKPERVKFNNHSRF